MRSLEVSDKSVDIAIFNGLQQMGLSIDEVSIEIIQTETKGILGIGAKPAKVRLTEKPAEEIVVPDFEAERAQQRERRGGDRRNNERRNDGEFGRSRDHGTTPRYGDERRSERNTDSRSDRRNDRRTERKPAETAPETVEAAPVETVRRRPEKKKPYKNIEEMFAAQGGASESPSFEGFESDDELGAATLLGAGSSGLYSGSIGTERPERSISEVVRDAERCADMAERTEPAETAEPAERIERPQTRNSRNNRRPERPVRQPEEFSEEPKPCMQPESEVVYTEEAAEGNPAAEFVKGLLEKMDIEGKVLASCEEGAIRLRIDSEAIGVLIGHRGENLDAIQYLTSLVVNRNRKEDGYTRITINTEDYREKREETLVRLAKRVAQQVKNTGRARVLEPMNPYERRILHSALQSNPYVATHSEGEEPNRRVVVTPKRRNRGYGSSRRPDNRRRNDGQRGGRTMNAARTGEARNRAEASTPAFTPENPAVPVQQRAEE